MDKETILKIGDETYKYEDGWLKSINNGERADDSKGGKGCMGHIKMNDDGTVEIMEESIEANDLLWWAKERDRIAVEAAKARQEAKADKGKIKPTLVPPQIIRDIAKVREYGCEKYKDPENWKKVEKERYENAFLRHTLAWMDARDSKDEESGIEHYKHMACNLAFLCEMYKKDEENGKCKMEKAEKGKQE